MSYRDTVFCENMNYPQFETVGEFDIPILENCRYQPVEFIGFNYAKTTKNKGSKGVHFFLDDYQFERLWRSPMAYIDLLYEYECVLTPDFSLYTDYPKALQIYNHWRKQWMGAFWQMCGMNVIPTASWSDRESFSWCFDGMPKQSTIAVSSVGTQDSKKAKAAFLDGWNECMRRLKPKTVIFYGNVPEECKGNIIRIETFQNKLRR